MTTEWPHKSPYAEAAARLQDAIAVAVLRDAINIRDNLDTLTSESERP